MSSKLTRGLPATITPQSVFDKALFGIRQQGGFAKSGGICRYRMSNLACAIGWLLPDDRYRKDLEGMSVEQLMGETLEELEGVDVNLLCDMQVAHDEAASLEEWETRMQYIAESFGLTYSPLKEAT